MINQSINQPVNIASWNMYASEPEPYPEGARVKTLVTCPPVPPYAFLKAEHQYLFKLSCDWSPEQFWIEIFAYQLGAHMNISVPPTFVAYNSNNNQCAALIEWFLSSVETIKEESESGGDLCQQLIPDYDRDKGKQHNFQTISQICLSFQKKYPALSFNWIADWAKIFLFDALIGNTDRHQNNWGIILAREYNEIDASNNVINIRVTPAFDNGTSMGYEVLPSRFKHFETKRRMEIYVSKGKHHMKWELNDAHGMQHGEMLSQLISIYPETHQIMLDCLLGVDNAVFEKILNNLIKFDIPIKLTPERANFMLQLINFRYKRLLSGLGK
jgi:hypothetical protein